MPDTSTKPYLIRAIHEWCSDSGYTPYLAVAVDSRTVVPREHVRNGEIVLNVSLMATHKLSLGNEFIEFQARFGGSARELSIPVENVTAIYARENGHGMAFDVPKPPAVSEDDAPVDAPLGDEPTPTVPPSAGVPAARRAPARRRGPRLVPVDGEGAGESGDDGASLGAAAAPLPVRGVGGAPSGPKAVPDAPASVAGPVSVPDSAGSRDASPADERKGSDAHAGNGDAADGNDGKGPDDRGPAPGRPRLTRIK